jgi:acetolactate synthase I/II/III large subunit
MIVKVSDLIRDFLEQKGVRHIFLVSGGMMMHLLDSVSKSKQIRYVCNHHEQASAIAAEAYAREAGSLGVCYATSGPGATNTVTGIAGAWLDSSPMIVITGQSRTSLTARGVGIPALRMVGNFEVDIVNIVHSITKYAVFVVDPKSILFHLEKAYHLALSGRPGPVLLDVPLDVQGAMVEESDLRHFEAAPETEAQPQSSFADLMDRLRKAERPLILAGHGVRVAGQASRFSELIDRARIPVVTTQLANDLMPYEHPFYIGHVGLRGDRAGNFAVQTCDFLMVIGCSLHVTTTGYELSQFAPSACKVVVDIDQAQLERNHIKAELLFHQDVGSFLSEIMVYFDASSRMAEWDLWLEKCRRWKRWFPVSAEPHLADGDQINIYRFLDGLSDALQGTETIVTDAGSLYYAVGQAFRVKLGQRVIVSGALGAMGYALPASIGAAFAHPSKNIICITGDGSLQTNVHELATLALHQLNCKIILNSNGGYASIRNTQNTFCQGNIAGSSSSTGVALPSWQKTAEAYGIPYLRVAHASQLSELFKTLVETAGPIVCEVVTIENVQMLPAVTSERLPNGSFKSNLLQDMSPRISPERLHEMEAG